MHWTFAIRIVQFIFAALVLCLSAAAIGEFSSGFNSLNFLLFTGIWGILSLIYLVLAPRAMPQLHHKFIVAGVEFLCMIFFFAGFIAVAADIGNVNCDFLGAFSSKIKTACQCTKAGIAFGAFSWLLFLVTLVLVVREIYLEQSGASQSAATTQAAKPEPMQMDQLGVRQDGNMNDDMNTGRVPMNDPNL